MGAHVQLRGDAEGETLAKRPLREREFEREMDVGINQAGQKGLTASLDNHTLMRWRNCGAHLGEDSVPYQHRSDEHDIPPIEDAHIAYEKG